MTSDDIARAVEEIGARLAALENTVREQEVWSGDVAMLNLDHETRLGKLEGKPEPQVDCAAALAALDPKPRGLDVEVSTPRFVVPRGAVLTREFPEVNGHVLEMKSTLDKFQLAVAAGEDRMLRDGLIELGWLPPLGKGPRTLSEIEAELRALNLRAGALRGERERLRGGVQ